MLVNLDIDRIAVGPRIIGPELALTKTHAVERLARFPRAIVSELLGVAEGPAQAIDNPALAADIPGCTNVTGRGGAPHHDRVARPISRRVFRYSVHGSSALRCRSSISAILRPSASIEITPRSIRVADIAAIQRS